MKKINKPGKPKNITLNKKNTIVFNLILIIVPIIIVVLFEFTLRAFNYGYDLKLFEKSVYHNGYLELNKKVARRYFTNFKASVVSNDIFLADKPDSCYRIFVMGESTARGFPYFTMATTFSRILNYRLQDAFPHKKIEVINTGLTAVNSYTLLDFADEILAQKPDLILIYAGHNEYYGSLGIGSVENGGNVRWLKMLQLKLVHLRSFQMMQNFVKYMAKKLSSEDNQGLGSTLMERIVKDKSIEYHSGIYYAGIDQFRRNIGELIAKAKKQGVKVIISEQICNVRDLKPFNSISSDKFPRADEIYNKARKLEMSSDFDNARKAYYLAKDLDIIRFRAPEDLNLAIHELGEKYNIPVVPMKLYFEEQSLHGLIGNNLITEHVHPNIDGYFLMADAFFNTIREAKYINPVWDSSLFKPLPYYRNNIGFSALDSLVADISIKILKNSWPFKTQSTVNYFKLNYIPKSLEDSLAFKLVRYENSKVEVVHKDLALHYSKQNNFIKAYKEYNALIKWYPYINELYFRAFYYLSAAGESLKACELLNSMPGIDTSYSALFQIGFAYYNQNEFKKAASYLEKAKAIASYSNQNELLLQLLYNAYISNGDEGKASSILSVITAINPKYVPSKKIMVDQFYVIPPSVKKEVNEATKASQEGNMDLALKYFFRANKIEENAYVNMCIGNILLKKKDISALNYFEKLYAAGHKNPDLLYMLTVLNINKGDYQKALDMLYQYSQYSTDYIKIIRLQEAIDLGLKTSG